MDVKGKLYYGDNLEVLRDKKNFPDEFVDLIYLDPPFNSNANYNVLYSSPKSGEQSHSQIQAFEDTWHWGPEAQLTFDDIMRLPNTDLASLMGALRSFLGENDMMAYLVMMAIRLLELHKVLKPTGSLYLHCDPTASHYLKLLLDAVFGHENFRNEIIWRRTNAHNKLSRQYGPIHDSILFYSKTGEAVFHPATRPYTRKYIEDRFNNYDENGRYQTNYLTGPGTRKGESGLPWRGFNPTDAGRHWAIPASINEFLSEDEKEMGTIEKLNTLLGKKLIVFPKKDGGQPMYKQYIGPGVLYQDIWAYQPNTEGVLFESNECIDEDVKYLENEEEKLGFQTQKPVGLLSRIIETSTNAGATVLDPFCGCGTAVHAAQKLGRNWIGIDITHLAISLIEKRMKAAFPGIVIVTEGIPKDLEGAQYLAIRDKYQFQWWAVSLVGAQPYQNKKKGSDGGIDGLIFFKDGEDGGYKKIIVSVKGGEHVGSGMIRDLLGASGENSSIRLFITLTEPTKEMRKVASAQPMYESPLTRERYPSVQILTIKGLMDGTERAEYPDLENYKGMFKAAKQERTEKETKLF